MPIDLPPPGFDLVARIDGIADRFMERWLGLIGVKTARFGGVLAPVAPDAPGVDFQNRPLYFGSAAADDVDEIVAFYDEHGVQPWYEISPSPQFEAVSERLAAHGAFHNGFHAAMYGIPLATAGPAAPGVSIDVASGVHGDLFGDVHTRGLEVSEGHRDAVAAVHSRWPEVAEWTTYLGFVDGEAAGAAVLVVDGDLAYLASAATVPSARGRGLQTALIERRMADAVARGASLVVSLCAFGSTSQRNMHRAGMRLSHLRAVWRGRAPR